MLKSLYLFEACQNQNGLQAKSKIQLNILGHNIQRHIPLLYFVYRIFNVVKGKEYETRLSFNFLELTSCKTQIEFSFF